MGVAQDHASGNGNGAIVGTEGTIFDQTKTCYVGLFRIGDSVAVAVDDASIPVGHGFPQAVAIAIDGLNGYSLRGVVCRCSAHFKLRCSGRFTAARGALNGAAIQQEGDRW